MISALQVQDYASNALKQGAEGLEALSSIGSSGMSPQNMHRSLMQIFGQPAGTPNIHWAEIPTARGKKTMFPFFLPHEFFSSMYKGSKKAWKRLCVNHEGCFEFWSHLKNTAFVKKHPDLPEHSFRHTVPIGMHGDGGAFSKHDSLFVISWTSLLAQGPTAGNGFFSVVSGN